MLALGLRGPDDDRRPPSSCVDFYGRCTGAGTSGGCEEEIGVSTTRDFRGVGLPNPGPLPVQAHPCDTPYDVEGRAHTHLGRDFRVGN